MGNPVMEGIADRNQQAITIDTWINHIGFSETDDGNKEDRYAVAQRMLLDPIGRLYTMASSWWYF